MSKGLDSISQILRDAAAAVTARDLQERLLSAVSQLDAFKTEYLKLQKEHGDLVACCRALETQIAADTEAHEFIEYKGAFFKISEFKEGRAVPYCIKCRVPLSYPPPKFDFPLRCSHCKFTAPFREADLAEIFAELSARVPQ